MHDVWALFDTLMVKSLWGYAQCVSAVWHCDDVKPLRVCTMCEHCLTLWWRKACEGMHDVWAMFDTVMTKSLWGYARCVSNAWHCDEEKPLRGCKMCEHCLTLWWKKPLRVCKMCEQCLTLWWSGIRWSDSPTLTSGQLLWQETWSYGETLWLTWWGSHGLAQSGSHLPVTCTHTHDNNVVQMRRVWKYSHTGMKLLCTLNDFCACNCKPMLYVYQDVQNIHQKSATERHAYSPPPRSIPLKTKFNWFLSLKSKTPNCLFWKLHFVLV